MAKILNRFLFSWQDIEARSDLQRLRLVVEYLPDEDLMVIMEAHRKNGRDDYPVRAVWNSILSGIVYQHASIESLRRELCRNGELRQACGFDPFLGDGAVPSARAYSHFLGLLYRYSDLVEALFDRLVEELASLLPAFGEKLAVDSKAIASFGKPSKGEPGDCRRDKDADWGKKVYRGERKDGSQWEKVIRWFGYKLHLLVDAVYELPLSFEVTTASTSDTAQLHTLVEKLSSRHASVCERSKELSADKAYDSEKNCRVIYDTYRIKPVIDIRRMWRDKEPRLLHPEKADNIVYDETGTLYCICPETNEQRELAYGGFEKQRLALKYTCPVKAYGIECKGSCDCAHAQKSMRVSLDRDRRLFTPCARSSYAWDRAYARRTSVERVNSRLDVSFGFEEHNIRGIKKMKMRVGLALLVMLAVAVGHIKEGRQEMMRSLVSPPKRAA